MWYRYNGLSRSIIIVIIIIIIIIIIIVIIMAFKGAIRFFFFCNLLTAPRTVSNTLAQVAQAQSCTVTCNTSSADHVQVSCYVPLGTKGQLSY